MDAESVNLNEVNKVCNKIAWLSIPAALQSDEALFCRISARFRATNLRGAPVRKQPSAYFYMLQLGYLPLLYFTPK